MERFKNWQSPEFDEKGMTKWGWMCQHPENLVLGKGVDIGFGSYLNAKFGIDIGDDVQIGGGVFIYSLSTIDYRYGKVVIKKGAKIGSGSRIMPGVTIGENATIGALSFVNKDIPDNVVAFGIPAKVRK